MARVSNRRREACTARPTRVSHPRNIATENRRPSALGFRSEGMNGLIDVPFADAAWTLAQVLLINAILSGDNAIIVGTAVVGLPPVQRLRALWLGIVAAMALR